MVGSRHIQRPICDNWDFDSQKRLSTGDGDLDRERLPWHERVLVCKTRRESERRARARGALVAGGGAPRNADRAQTCSECLTPSLFKQQPQRQCASGDIVQIQVHDDARIVFARPAPPEGEGRRRCVGGTAFRSTSTLPAKANGFVWLGAGRRGCVVVVVGLPQDCQCNLAALLPQSECGRSQACGHDCFLDRREATCRRRLRV